MHFVVLAFALGTSTTGLVTGMFYPAHVGPGRLLKTSCCAGFFVSHVVLLDLQSKDAFGVILLKVTYAPTTVVVPKSLHGPVLACRRCSVSSP